MSKVKVFLSGAIEGTPDSGEGWRKDASSYLVLLGYEVLDPTLNESGMTEVNEVVDKNRWLQSKADLLLVEYMIPNRAYIGTDYELVMAKEWKQPAIVFAHEMHRNRLYLQYLSTVITEDMGSALEYIHSVYPNEI